MAKCDFCGYTFHTEEERRLYDMYGCARTRITKDTGMQVEMCSFDPLSSSYYAPGTHPDKIQEDPEAFKENYAKLIDQKKKPK